MLILVAGRCGAVRPLCPVIKIFIVVSIGRFCWIIDGLAGRRSEIYEGKRPFFYLTYALKMKKIPLLGRNGVSHHWLRAPVSLFGKIREGHSPPVLIVMKLATALNEQPKRYSGKNHSTSFTRVS